MPELVSSLPESQDEGNMVLVRALYVTFPEKPVTILIIIRQQLVNLPMLVKSIDIAGRLSPRNGSKSVLPPSLFTMTCVRKFTNFIDNIDTVIYFRHRKFTDVGR